MLATLAMFGHLSHASFANGPLNIVPFGFPFSSFDITAELSSNFILVPSGLLYSFFCLTMMAKTTCFLMSGLPFFTAAMHKSPTPAAWILPLTVLWPNTENIFMTLAPELSQVSIRLPTGSPLVTLAFTASIFYTIILILFPFLPCCFLLLPLFFLSLRSFLGLLQFLLPKLFHYHKMLCLAQRPAFHDFHYIAALRIYARRIMGLQLRPSSFISLVFGDIMHPLPSNCGCLLRLATEDYACECPAPDL